VTAARIPTAVTRLPLPSRPVLAFLAVLALLTAGCSSASPSRPASAFDAGAFDKGAAAPGCMRHQQRSPTAADNGGPGADTARRLAILRYYTANGNAPFCDGKPADATDLSWMRNYLDQGADRSHVARWVPAP